MKRLPLTHLLAILAALAVLAAGAWWYTNANEPVEGIPPVQEQAAPTDKDSCEARGGVWNECASACPPDAEACILMCVQKCEGLGDGKTVVEVHFPNAKNDPNMLDCSASYPFRRAVSGDAAKAALEALLSGPTDEEQAAGAFTSVPQGVALKSVVVKDGVAYADFSAQMKRAAGSCLVTSIRAQIEKTLLGIEGVNSVVISVEGDAEEALQP